MTDTDPDRGAFVNPGSRTPSRSSPAFASASPPAAAGRTHEIERHLGALETLCNRGMKSDDVRAARSRLASLRSLIGV